MGMNVNIQDLALNLKSRRSEMIDNLKSWPIGELTKLINKYQAARDLAEEENRLESLILLDEKIFQVSAAMNLVRASKEISV